MPQPHFFCRVSALKPLLSTQSGQPCPERDLCMDLIELPWLLVYTVSPQERLARVISRGELYSTDGGGIVLGSIAENRRSGGLHTDAPWKLGRYLPMLLQVCSILSAVYAPSYPSVEPDLGGMLLSVEEDALTCGIVTGKARPELVCTTLFGETVLCRPYMDEFMAHSARDLMSLEEKTEEAEAGDTELMEELAQLYRTGDDEVAPDPEQAVYWLTRLAQAGHAAGQFRLGLHLARGLGVARSDSGALYWLEQAAGHAEAPQTLVQQCHEAITALRKARQGAISPASAIDILNRLEAQRGFAAPWEAEETLRLAVHHFEKQKNSEASDSNQA